jgi:ribose 5-phosphate isomerase B
MQKIFLASDHRGFKLKEEIKSYLSSCGYTVSDCGNLVYDKDDDTNDFANKLAVGLNKESESLGISFCGSGIGMALAANRHKGIRAAVAHTENETITACLHNHINVLSLPADIMSLDDAKKIVNAYLLSPRSTEERYVRRIKKLDL